MKLRRKDRQMTEEFAWSVVDKCEYAVLAMTAEDGGPYCVPITIVRDGKTICFHSAKEGRKASILRTCPRVCLTCVGDTRMQPEIFSTLYESAVAFGTVTEITDEDEKTAVLRLLCLRHAPEHMAGFPEEVAANLRRTAVWRMNVEEITGKANQR